MVKKELTNKKVVRAIALGLSAVMLTTPITAHAEEANSGDDNTGNVPASKIDVPAAKNPDVAPVAGLVETAQQSTTDAGTSTNEKGSVVYNSADDAAAAAGEVIDATVKVTETDENGNETTNDVGYDDVVAKEEASNEKLDTVDGNLSVLDQMESALDKVADGVDTKVDNANNSLDTFGTVKTQDATDAADAAEAAADIAKDFNSSEATVNQAVIDASNAVAAAEEVAKEAQDAYDAAEAELVAAREAADAAQARYNAAQSTLGTTQDEMEKAYQAAVDAKEYADALQKEVNDKKLAFEQANVVALNLADLEQKMYKAAGETTIDAYDKAEGMLFGTESASTAYWKASLEYFKAYMQYVFNNMDNVSNVEYQWNEKTYTDGDVKYGNAGGNEYVIKYTGPLLDKDGNEIKDENGQVVIGEVTRYFNYHADPTTIDPDTKKPDGSIVIYEKFNNYQAPVDGQDEKWEYVSVDKDGNEIKYSSPQDGSDITYDKTSTLEDGTTVTSKWVADKESVEITPAIDETTQSYDENADSTYTKKEVIVVEEVIGTETVIVENTDSSLIKEFQNKVECREYVKNYMMTPGNTVEVQYVVDGESHKVVFNGIFTWDDWVEFVAGGKYVVKYSKEETQDITQKKTVLVEKKYAIVETETEELLEDVDNGEHKTEMKWVETYTEEQDVEVKAHWETVKTAEEVAREAANAEADILRTKGHEVKDADINVYQIATGPNTGKWTYTIKYTVESGETDTWNEAYQDQKEWVEGHNVEQDVLVEAHWETVKTAEEGAREAAEAEAESLRTSGCDVTDIQVYEIKDRWGRGTGEWTYTIAGVKEEKQPLCDDENKIYEGYGAKSKANSAATQAAKNYREAGYDISNVLVYEIKDRWGRGTGEWTYTIIGEKKSEKPFEDKNNGSYENQKEWVEEHTEKQDVWVEAHWETVKTAEDVARQAANSEANSLREEGHKVDDSDIKVYEITDKWGRGTGKWTYAITYTKIIDLTDNYNASYGAEVKWVETHTEKQNVTIPAHWETVKTAKDVATEAANAEVETLRNAGYVINDSDIKVYEITDKWGRGTGKWTYTIKGTKTTYVTSEEAILVSTAQYDATEYKHVCTQQKIDPVAEKRWWSENKASFDDTIMKKAMNDALTELNNYVAQQQAAADAAKAAEKARQDVENAKEALEKLSIGAEYAKAVTALKAAEDRLKAAEEKLVAINEEVVRAQTAYAEAAAQLGRFVDNDTDDSDDDTTPAVFPVVTPVVLADAPVAPAAVAVAAAGAGQAVVNIDDEATPLAAGIDDANANGGDDEVIVAEAQEEEPAIVAIEDEETPLAAGVGADGKMSWWWLLIVALLGATGYKMYKDHQKKKEEAQEA